MAEDARISTGLPTHPKTRKLERSLGAAGFRSLVCLFLWVRSSSRWDGNLAGMRDDDIELAADWNGETGAFVRTLADVGFVDGESGQYRVHDWKDHNPWAAAQGERIENSREAAYSKWSKLAPTERSAAASKASRARWDKVRAERLAIAQAKGTHTAQEWEILLAVCEYRCLRCGADDAPLVKDHIVPIYYTERPDATDGIENLQPLCDFCNRRKGSETRDLRPPGWRDACAMHATRMHVRAPNQTVLLEEKNSNASACKTEMRATRTDEPTADEMVLFRVRQQLRDEGRVTGALAEWAEQRGITHCYIDGRPIALADALPDREGVA